jgi:O-antigen/teichoic acid export membrane protein
MPKTADPSGSPVGMKQLGRHVLIYGLGLVLSRAVSFLMLPIYTRFLTPADYGAMELIQMTLDVISIAAGAQLALGMFRYYHMTDDRREKEAVISTALVALGISYAMVAIATYAGSGFLSNLVFGSDRLAGLIRIASLNLACQSLLIVPLAYARLKDRSTLFVTANALKLVVGVGLNLLFLVHMGMGIKGIFLSSLIANILVGGWLTIMVLREVGLRISRTASRNLLRYGVPLIAMHLANFIITFSDRYFLQAAGNPTVVGLYTLAYVFGFMLAMIGYMPFETVWEPKRFEIARQHNRDEMYARAFVYLNVLLISAAVGIALFAGDLLRVMSAPAFHSAADIVPILLIAYILQGWTGMQNVGILIREKTEYLAAAHWAGAATALLLFYLLIPRYMQWGAAAAASIAFFVRYVLVYAISQKLWPVRYRWAPVLRLVSAAILVVVVAELLPALSLPMSLVARTGLLTLYLAALWHLGILTSSDKAHGKTTLLTIAAWLTTMRPRPGAIDDAQAGSKRT